jgi:GxxExxY protein
MNDARRDGLLEEKLTRSVIGVFFDLHWTLGFGYREHLYSLALERDLVDKGHKVEREVAVMVYHRGKPLAWQVLDMVVDEKLIVEIKATEQLNPSARRQLFSYLYATTLEVGLLLHFGSKPSFHRVICENRFKRHRSPPSASAGGA